MELASANLHLIRGFNGDDLMAKRCQPLGVAARASSYVQDKRRSCGRQSTSHACARVAGTDSYCKAASFAFASYQSMGSMGFNDSPSVAILSYRVIARQALMAFLIYRIEG